MKKYAKAIEPKEEFSNSTNPLPVICDSCGHELPYEKKNKDEFVYYLQCEDLNRKNATITNKPGYFCKTVKSNNNEIIAGSSDSGYSLKDNYRFKSWITWCCKCHVTKTQLQFNNRKTNNLKPTGKAPALSIDDALKKLRKMQMQCRPSV